MSQLVYDVTLNMPLVAHIDEKMYDIDYGSEHQTPCVCLSATHAIPVRTTKFGMVMPGGRLKSH